MDIEMDDGEGDSVDVTNEVSFISSVGKSNIPTIVFDFWHGELDLEIKIPVPVSFFILFLSSRAKVSLTTEVLLL
jgi:hypothetical protein